MGRRRSANPFDEGSDDPDADVSPLIDVAFLLLIYFLVTTTLLKEEADIGLTLPGISSSESEQVDVDQMMITIKSDGSVWVNDEMTDSDQNDRRLPVLTDRLDRYAATVRLAQAEAMVIIDCDNSTENQRFIDVLNACAHTGLKNVSLAQPPK